MKLPLLFATTLLGLLATGARAACGQYHRSEAGDKFYLYCGHYACNVLELDGSNTVLGKQGVNPVGSGSCYIEVRVHGDKGIWHRSNHENTATIHHTGDLSCDSASIGVSLAGPSVGLTCSSESQAWCGTELPNERRAEGTISGSCLDNYASCYGWTRASDYGKEDRYEDNPTCWKSGTE
eukprot:g15964.t1